MCRCIINKQHYGSKVSTAEHASVIVSVFYEKCHQNRTRHNDALRRLTIGFLLEQPLYKIHIDRAFVFGLNLATVRAPEAVGNPFEGHLRYIYFPYFTT